MKTPKIIVKGYTDNKVSAIRMLRKATGCSLKEAKDAVELQDEAQVKFELQGEGERALEENQCLVFEYEIADAVERSLQEALKLLVEDRRYSDASTVLEALIEVTA